jgi:putative FmdB family regulatory protein
MPTYEYICKSCGHEFEEFQSMTAPTLRKCPKCKKSALERKIGLGGGIIFKGGGFYETDYRSDSYKKSADADTKAASGKTEEKKDGHVHTGACGCGKKPADQCPSAAAPPAEPKRAKPVSLGTSAKRTSRKSAARK